MKICRVFEELLGAKLDGELSAEESRRLEEHLSACEPCRREFERLERAWNALGVLGEIEPSADLADRVFVRTVGRGRWLRRAAKVLAPMAAAAAVLLVVISGMLRNGTDNTTDPIASPAVAEAEIVQNLEILDNLELLENLDMLEAMGEDYTTLPTLEAFEPESNS